MSHLLPSTLFDWVVLLYLLWSMLRGWRRGFYPQLYAAVSAILLLAMLAGFSLTTVLWHSLDHLLRDYLHLSRLLGVLLLLVLMAWLLWKIRSYLSGLKKKKSRSSVFGVVMGLCQSLLWVAVVLVIARLLPFGLSSVLYSTAARLWRPLVGLIVQ